MAASSDLAVGLKAAGGRTPQDGRRTLVPRGQQSHHLNTRMVQLPATAAIEYVAACCRTRTRTRTKTKTTTETKTRTKIITRTKIGTITKIVRGPYARSPQVQYVYAPSGLSVPSNVA